MQSTSMTSARTVIMLICMIALPVFALLGSGWTRYLEWGSTNEENSHRERAGRAGRVASSAPQTGLAEMIRGQSLRANPPRADEPPAGGPSQPRQFPPSVPTRPLVQVQRSAMPGNGPNAPLAANFEATAGGQAGEPQPVVQASRTDDVPMVLPRPPVPVGSRRNGTAARVQPAELGNERSHRQVAGQAGQRPADWFAAVTQRLRDLGATYYLLETWGRNGELYRFHCKMSVASGKSYTRHFEATDADAGTAMRSVLEQVEAWRTARSR